MTVLCEFTTHTLDSASSMHKHLHVYLVDFTQSPTDYFMVILDQLTILRLMEVQQLAEEATGMYVIPYVTRKVCLGCVPLYHRSGIFCVPHQYDSVHAFLHRINFCSCH